MAIRTTLSNAALRYRGESASRPATIRGAAARYPSTESKRVTAGFLIANTRLVFRLTHRKHSHLKISNRKWIAICRIDSHGASESPGRTPLAQARTLDIFSRNRRRHCSGRRTPFTNHELRITSHGIFISCKRGREGRFEKPGSAIANGGYALPSRTCIRIRSTRKEAAS